MGTDAYEEWLKIFENAFHKESYQNVFCNMYDGVFGFDIYITPFDDAYDTKVVDLFTLIGDYVKMNEDRSELQEFAKLLRRAADKAENKPNTRGE